MEHFTVKYESYEEPIFFNELRNRYNEFFKKKQHRAKPNVIKKCFENSTTSGYNECRVDETESDENDCDIDRNNSDDDEIENDNGESENELLEENYYRTKFYKDEKKKFRVKQNKNESIFRTITNINVDYTSDHSVKLNDYYTDLPDDYMLKFPVNNTLYGIDYNHFISNFKPTGDIFINYFGGFVVDPIEKKFLTKKVPSFNGIEDDIMCNIIDFNSLYPSVMKTYNICHSTLNTNSKYPILIDNKLYSPYDVNIFYITISYLKINSVYLPFVTFTTKENYRLSLITQFINKNTGDRKKFKRVMEENDHMKMSMVYINANNTQLALKLRDNGRYGLFNSLFSPLFNPILSSLITYYGRLKLCSLLFFSIYFFKKHGINGRKPLYGDTDSLFFTCTRNEMEQVISEFKMLRINKGIIAVDIEKSLPYTLFLSKKNYLCLNKSSVYCKGIVKKSQSVPSKIFLLKFIDMIFKEMFQNKDYHETLNNLFANFLNSSDEKFKKMQILSRNLNEYSEKNKYKMIFAQMNYAKYNNGINYDKGTQISYAYYKYIFDYDFKQKLEDFKDDVKKKSEYEKMKKMPNIFGELNYSNIDQIRYIKKNKASTILIEDLVKDYSNIEIDKEKIFNSDLSSILDKIFSALDDAIFFKIFDNIYKESFGLNYKYLENIKLERLPTKRKKDDVKCTEFCNQLITKYNQVKKKRNC